MRQREQILGALLVAQTDWRDVLAVIADSADADEAGTRLSAQFGFNEMQSTAVLDMQCRRLSILDRSRIEAELAELPAQITELARRVKEA